MHSNHFIVRQCKTRCEPEGSTPYHSLSSVPSVADFD